MTSLAFSQFSPLAEALASRAVIVIVYELDGGLVGIWAETLLEKAEQLKNGKR